MIKKLNDLILIFLISLILFLFLDFVFGKSVSRLLKIENVEEIYRVKNTNYSYTFKENFKTDSAVWGKKYYKFCSNNLGFKFNCIDKIQNNYEIVFIGDSMTEGIGLPYEKTFVGKFHNKVNLSVANMAVSSYSPNIYFKKIKYFIDNNLKFDHLIAGVDLTDFQDDWKRNNIEKKIKNDIRKKINFKDNLKVFLRKNLSISYFIFKQINWYYKLNFTKYADHKHLDYYSNSASWSYLPKGKNFYDKKKIILKNLDNLYDLTNDRGIKFSIIIFPHQASVLYDKRNSTYYSIFKNFCIQKCYRFFDGYNIFFDMIDKTSRKEVSERYFIKYDSHLNENGHHVISKILLNNL